DRRGHGRVLL
nr:immunoglobulin heavy chain junction region [Homo sapiens]